WSEIVHESANGGNDATKSPTRDGRQRQRHKILDETIPKLPVKWVHASCADSDEHFTRTRIRTRNLLIMHLLRTAVLVNANCVHYSHRISGFGFFSCLLL